MGADLILMAVPFPVYTDGTPVKADDTNAREILKQRVRDALVNDDLFNEIYEEQHGEGWDEDDGETREEIVEGFVDGLDAVFGGYRDTATFTLDGKLWLFAGGTSWGDSFESMDQLSAIWETGALKDPVPVETVTPL